MDYVIDTNVPLTAHGSANHMSEDCKLKCQKLLIDFLTAEDYLVIDSGLDILNEYRNSMNYEGANSVGRQFLKWVLNNYFNPTRVRQVDISQLAINNYQNLPPAFTEFDAADKKFLAVALVNGVATTTIVQAADGKWLEWEDEFRESNILVAFPCHEELKNAAAVV